MDAPGAGTGRSEPAGVTEGSGNVTAGPARPVGRADATGPLPVQPPADATGPLPASEANSWFSPAAETAAQPVIPPETAATLFDPEPRAPRVGLPLTAELCAAMGGQVRYEPAPSGGARFLVAFKLAPASAPSPDDEP